MSWGQFISLKNLSLFLGLETNLEFIWVKSMYKIICKSEVDPNFAFNWKSKIHLKIKTFLWLLFKNYFLTNDNMIKRRWPGNPTCYFWDQDEIAHHLFFNCKVAKVIWGIAGKCMGANCGPTNLWQFFSWMHPFCPDIEKLCVVIFAAFCWTIWIPRNNACFEKKKMIRSPIEII